MRDAGWAGSPAGELPGDRSGVSRPGAFAAVADLRGAPSAGRVAETGEVSGGPSARGSHDTRTHRPRGSHGWRPPPRGTSPLPNDGRAGACEVALDRFPPLSLGRAMREGTGRTGGVSWSSTNLPTAPRSFS